MSLAPHTAKPSLFRLHRELQKFPRSRKLELNTEAIGDRTLFGCEVETETFYEGDHYAIKRRTGWVPTRDGSINGAEWKSPLMLPDDPIHPAIEEIIETSTYSGRCGGHIHAVRGHWHGMDVDAAFDAILENWAWFFASLYSGRCVYMYCDVRNAFHRDMLSTPGRTLYRSSMYTRRVKYTWLRIIDSNRIEFRIFPSVHTVRILRMRMRMLDYLLANFHRPHNPDQALQMVKDELSLALGFDRKMIEIPPMNIEVARTACGHMLKWPRHLSATTGFSIPTTFSTTPQTETNTIA